MVDTTNPESWSIEQVKACFTAAASANENGRPIYKLLPALKQIIRAVETLEVSGCMLKHIDKNFLQNEAGVAKWPDQTACLIFIEDLLKRPAHTIDRIKFKYSGDAESADEGTRDPARAESSVDVLLDHPPTSSVKHQQRRFQTTADDSGKLSPYLEPGHRLGKKHKRTTVQTIAPLKQKSADMQLQEHTTGYMPPLKLSFDHVFFSETEVGSQIMLERLGDDDFEFHSKPTSLAIAQSLNNRFKYFFGKPLSIGIRNAPPRSMTITPYRLNLKARPSAVVFQQVGENKCKPYRALISSTVDGLQAIFNDEPEDEYSDILRRYPDQPEDDSDVLSTGNVSSMMEISTETSDGESMAEEGPEEFDLGNEAIEAVIEDAITTFETAWEAKLPRLEKSRARTVWRRMKSSRLIREHLIAVARKALAHLKERLTSQRMELLRTDFKDVIEVRRNCEIMQPTVEQIKHKQWEIDVWQRRREPVGENIPSKPRPVDIQSRPTHHGTSAIANNLLAHLGADDRLTLSASGSPQQNTQELQSPTDLGPEDEPTRSDVPTQAQPEVPDGTSMKDFVTDDEELPDHARRHDADAQSDISGHEEGLSEHQADVLGHITPRNELSSTTSIISISDDSSTHNARRAINAMTPIKATKKVSKLEKMSAFVDAFSSDSEPIPPPKRVKLENSSPNDPMLQAQKHQAAIKKEIKDMTAEDVENLDTSQLIFDRDHRRLLLKLLSSESSGFRDRLSQFCSKHADNFAKYMLAALETVVHSLEPEQRLHDFDDGQRQTLLRCARMAISWWSSDEQMMMDDFMDWDGCQEFLDDADQILLFCGELTDLLHQKDRRLFVKAPVTSQANPYVIDSSDDNGDGDDSPPTKRKPKRKRKVKSSQEAYDNRKAAFVRQERFKKMQLSQSDSSKLAQMLSDDHVNFKLEINPSRDQEASPIYVDGRIAKQLKSHQIEGVQFLWRELTAKEEHGVRGCLLAHEMGLGKTIQSITAMLTILKTSQSDDNGVRQQLPKHLRPKEVLRGDRLLRMLVLCPPTLIINWQKEIYQWAGHALGDVYTVYGLSIDQRFDVIEQWKENGGVLLLGYHMFVSIHEKQTSASASLALNTLQHDTELVVADEAHHFKNTKSKANKAVMSLSAKSRLAMSGTPMSNDIDEIFSLISWISPGYLGLKEEFNARYANPIKDGLFADSSAYERRKSQKKLMVLRSEIEPKYLRADITVLKGAMKPKIEYILTVAPTQMQTAAYRRFTTALKGEIESTQTSPVQLFGMLSALTLLLNHPWSFRRRLLDNFKPTKDAARLADEERTDGASDAQDAPSSTLPILSKRGDIDESLMDLVDDGNGFQGLSEQTMRGIVHGIEDDIDEQLSAKTALFTDILTRSLAVKDKILVFSNKIHTLDYLSELLSTKRIVFGRIDGKTAIPERTNLIKDMDKDRIHVMLISTRAGGVGLNMQKANRVVIFDSGFNPMHEQQAIGRAYRIGQQKPVFVYRFVAGGTFEINMENRQLFKTSLAQRVVDKKQPLRNALRSISKWLYNPTDVVEKDISEWLGKDPGVLDDIIQAQLSQSEEANRHKIFAIKTMETLQADAKDPELDEAEKLEVEQEIAEGRSMRLRSRAVPQPQANAVPSSTAPVTTAPYLSGAQLPQYYTPTMSPIVPQPGRFGMVGTASRQYGFTQGRDSLGVPQ